MALVKKSCNYQKYLFLLISFTCVVSVLCSKNVFNELFLQQHEDKSCPVSATHDSLPEQKFKSKVDASISESKPKENNVFDTLKVILKKVKHEVNSDTQEDPFKNGAELNSKLDTTNDNDLNLVNKVPKSKNESVDLQNTTDELNLQVEGNPVALDLVEISKKDFSGDRQSLKKVKKDDIDIFKLRKQTSEERVSGKSTITEIFEASSDNFQSREKSTPIDEQQKNQQQFENIPHRGTYTDISKLSSEGIPQNNSEKDERVSDLPQKTKHEEDKHEKTIPFLLKNDSIIEEESLKIQNETESEAALDLTKPRAEDVPETDVNASTVLPQQELLDEARKEKDQLETYSQFAERVSAEKKNGVGNGHGSNGQSSKGSKVKSKNYASTDCGAKFIAANPESSHSHKIINSNKDEYMLNKCTGKLWVVVELCESIKPQKFDIANFELFSNLPKEIQLYGSHRYPTREWIALGTYIGEEGNRGTQSFHVDTQEFLKYIKLEVNSHYGTEYFCPLSQFRIYGMSEFEVIEEAEDTEEEPAIEDEEIELEAKADMADMEKDKRGIMIPDIFKAIFNGVLEVIKRGSRSGNLTEESELIKYNETCKSLKDEFTIKNELCHFADSINYILACYYDEYLKLMLNPFISQVVKNYDFCHSLATIICSSPQNNDSYVYDSICNNSYACVMISPKHILAMCHMNNPLLLSDILACETEDESSDAKNLSTTDSTIGELPLDIAVLDTNDETFTDIEGKLPSYEKNKSSFSQKVIPPSDTNGLKIETLSNNLDNDIPVESPLDSKQTTKEETKSFPSLTVNKVENASSIETQKTSEKIDKAEKQGDTKKDKKAEKIQEKSSVGSDDQGPQVTTTTAAPPPSTAIPSGSNEGRVTSHSNKESVVVRLSNKIKVLEQNMSISSQYLEELSRRYKIQMEEMERQFNITIHALNRTSQTAFERDVYHQKRIEGLEEQVEQLTKIVTTIVKEKETFLKSVFEHHIILLVIQVLVIGFAFTFCMKRVRTDLSAQEMGHLSTPAANQIIQKQISLLKENRIVVSESEVQGRETSQFRRMSVDSLKMGNQEKPKERRLSGQTALKGTYQDLLIAEQSSVTVAENPKEKRRKKKKAQLQRSISNVSIHESKDCSLKKEGKLDKLKKSSAGVLFSGENITQTTSKSKSKSEIVGGQSVEDIRKDDWQLVKRNKSKKWKNELNSQQEEEQNYVFSSDLKRGKITVVEEPFCDVYPSPYYAEILYDDYVYDKAYIEEEYKDLNDCDYEAPLVESNGIGNSITHTYTASEFDYNAPVINDYYHNTRDSTSYNVVGNEIDNNYEQVNNEDSNINIWNHTVIVKPIVKPLRNTSVPPSLKGKTRLRSDNWEWYSSQPSRLLPKSSSTEIISNSSSDSNGRPKQQHQQQQQQQQQQETKSNKEKFEKKKRKKKSKLLINGEDP